MAGLLKMYLNLALSLLIAGLISTQVPPPAGFRYPTDADWSGDWQEFRSKMPKPFHAQADFNGREPGEGWSLFVFLGQKNDSPLVVKLVEDDGAAADSPY